MSPRRALKGPGLHLAMLALVLALLAACSTPSAQELAPDDAPTAVLAQAPPPPTPTPQPTITLVAIGDLMLARDLVTLMDRYGAMYPFEHVEPMLSDADITVANLGGNLHRPRDSSRQDVRVPHAATRCSRACTGRHRRGLTGEQPRA